MFKNDSFLGNKNSSSNQNVWRNHATMQQDVMMHFLVILLYWNQTEIWKNILLSSSRAFSLSTPTFSLCTPVDNSEATWKKATKCSKQIWSWTKIVQVQIMFAIWPIYKKVGPYPKTFVNTVPKTILVL